MSKDITRDSGIPIYVESLVLDGKGFEAHRELQRLTDCSVKEAIQTIKKWKKDRADKIGR